MSALLDFHDAVIYQRDLDNFYDGNWLNDACIGFCLRYMEQVVFQQSDHLLFLDPSVVSLIKVQSMDEEDLEGISRGLKLSTRKLLFVPTNDNNSFAESSSHWSLLVLDTVNEEAYHFDSCKPKNSSAADITFQRMQPLLEWKRYSKVKEVHNCPQQTNGFDCGVYVCLFVQEIASSPLISSMLQMNENAEACDPPNKIFAQISEQIASSINPASATQYRESSLKLISELSKDYLSKRNST